MKLKISLLFLVATFLALAAGYVSFVWLGSVQKELTSTRAKLEAFGQLTPVRIPTRDVAAGEALAPEDFRTLSMPATYLPADSLTVLPAVTEDKSLRAMIDLKAGQLLTHVMIGTAPKDEPPIAELAAGRSAAPFPIENLTALRQLLKVGSIVDLYSYTSRESQNEMRLVTSGLEVMLPLQSQSDAGTAAPQVILGGPNAAIVRALLARQDGKLQLALASQQPSLSTGPVVVTARDLAVGNNSNTSPGVVQVVRPVPEAGSAMPVNLPNFGSNPQKEICTTAVIRAGTRVQVEVPCQ